MTYPAGLSDLQVTQLRNLYTLRDAKHEVLHCQKLISILAWLSCLEAKINACTVNVCTGTYLSG